MIEIARLIEIAPCLTVRTSKAKTKQSKCLLAKLRHYVNPILHRTIYIIYAIFEF